MITGILAALLVTTSAALTQDAGVPAPPSERLLAGGRNPVVSYLMQAYGLSEADARIHKSGTDNCVGTGTACDAYFMPIEYIDDHDPTIKLPSTP